MENKVRIPNTTCLYCNKQIYRRPSQIQKHQGNTYCSLQCFGKYHSKPQKCIVCQKEYPRKLNKKTCSRTCANQNRAGIKYKLNRPKDKVTKSDSLKIRLIIDRGTSCERCQYNITDILIVHHKNRDRKNNELSNLELLCPNCHCEEHYLEKSWFKRYNVERFKNKLSAYTGVSENL